MCGCVCVLCLACCTAGPRAVARKATVEVKAFEEGKEETDEQIADRCMH